MEQKIQKQTQIYGNSRVYRDGIIQWRKDRLLDNGTWGN